MEDGDNFNTADMIEDISVFRCNNFLRDGLPWSYEQETISEAANFISVENWSEEGKEEYYDNLIFNKSS